MYDNNALGVYPHAEGVPISGVYYNRASSVVSGSEVGLRAGAGGVAIGRFGWAEPDGTVSNARVSDAGVIGLVVIQSGDWRRVYWDGTTHTWRIREGLNLTMLSAAPGILVHIPNGAQWNQRVYTSPLDGIPVAGYAVDLEPTRWAVGKPHTPGGLSLLTTWNPLT
jgi:hypothetical protein